MAPSRAGGRGPKLGRACSFILSCAAAFGLPPNDVRAADEIQVYNAEIAEVGQWTIEEHLNYVARGQMQADFPGGLVPNHSLNGTPELAYGVTEWWELGLYAPFSVASISSSNASSISSNANSNGGNAMSNNNGGPAQEGPRFYSDAFKLRTLFVTPDAEKRDFFYGANFEFSYVTPKFAQTQFLAELRPIIGVRNNGIELIVNPIVDFAPGDHGSVDFAPAVRLARKFEKDFSLGFEYYADFGQIGHFLPLQQQLHDLFAVTDFKVGDFDVDFGIGHGFTSASDRLIFKMIIGYAFPVTRDTSGLAKWLQKSFALSRSDSH
jgi:hypothetical protein